MPKLSVIIPTYNRIDLLKEAVESILNQTVKDIEVIIVDDGSIDETLQIVKNFPDNVRYFTQSHSGLNAARNLAMQHAQGEFIALLDDDDLWLPFKTELQLAVMARFPDVAFVFSDFTIFDEDGIKATEGLSTWNRFPGSWQVDLELRKSAQQMVLPLPPDGRDYHVYLGKLYQLLLYDVYVLPSTAIIRRSSIESDSPFPVDNIHCGDWQFFAELSRNAPCVFLSLPTALNRSHGDAVRLTRKSPRIRIQDRLSLIDDVWRSDIDFMATHAAEVGRVESEQLCKLVLLCLLENRRMDALEYLERWRLLPIKRLNSKRRLLYLAACLPFSPHLLQLLRRMKQSWHS